MDAVVIAFIWIAIMAFDFYRKNKDRQQRPPRNDRATNPDFDIPTLSNDPNFPDDFPIFVEDTKQTAEVREVDLGEVYRRKKVSQQARIDHRREEPTTEVERKEFDPNLTPADAMNAIIWSEILGKPKALRRRSA